MEITVAMDYGASMTIEMEREFPFCFFFFLFLLLTIPRLAFLFPSSKFDHLPSTVIKKLTDQRFHAFRISKIVLKNVETFSIHAGNCQIETKLKKKPDSWRNARIETTNPFQIDVSSTIELQQAMYSFFRERTIFRSLSNGIPQRVNAPAPIAFTLAPRDILHPPSLPYCYSTAFAFDANFSPEAAGY